MSLYFTSLNSGSNGNCYYVGNSQEAVLVDAGISCRETERRMARLGLDMGKVKAIVVSHEHVDHIRGIPVLSKKYNLPVYITESTLRHSGMQLEGRAFSAAEPIRIGELEIQPFVKYHDAADPHSFLISCGQARVGVFTDIGRPCGELARYFSMCHAAFLETNYDTEMLDKGRYPIFLKNRIRGGHGHLSNNEALEVFLRHRTRHLSHVLLSHLSQDNNDPDLVHALFTRHSNGTEIVVAGRYAETPVFHINPSEAPEPVCLPIPQQPAILPQPASGRKSSPQRNRPVQTSLF